MAKRITFPKVSGTNTWRNAETGIVIRKSEPDNGDGTYYTVEVAGRDATDVIMSWSAPKLAEAREYAVGAVVAFRAMIASHYSDAITENAKRALAKWAADEALAICASIPIDGRPSEVTELLAAAELLTDEHEHLAAVRHARKIYDARTERLRTEAARQLNAHDDYARKQFPSVFEILDAAN